MKYLFCYGSNNPAQLKERLGHAVDPVSAYAENYRRVYRGFSQKWNGGVASLIKKPGHVTYGIAVQVTAADLSTMDRFEGVASGNYKRINIPCVIMELPMSAIAYVSLSKEWNAPSDQYLKAIFKTVTTSWNVDSYHDFYNED